MNDPEKREQPAPTDDELDRKELEDLDVGGDADKVIGGMISCPCEGGEIRRR